MAEIRRIDKIETIHSLLRLGVQKHKHVLLVDYHNASALNQLGGIKLLTGFYIISYKDRDCGIRYGRKSYDFSEGSLLFAAPGQTISFDAQDSTSDGWLLLIHPDLLRKFSLGNKMDDYTFFGYELSEALHLSLREKETIQNIVTEIKLELENNEDNYTTEVIVSNIELMLNYAKRFYGRQFITRKAENSDVFTKFEQYLCAYVTERSLENNGIPTVSMLANDLGYSSDYLSDLLRRETGKTVQEHIHQKILELSKNMLLYSDNTISEISYRLGFGYPAHFSNFFKNKTGITPGKYRKLNNV